MTRFNHEQRAARIAMAEAAVLKVGQVLQAIVTATDSDGTSTLKLGDQTVQAQLPQPLALLEVGASAGLCLLPDRYGYDYGDVRLVTTRRPCLSCVASPETPLPTQLPQVVWRAGLDLNPLEPSDAQHRGWLEALVWPEQHDRLGRLRDALAVAREVRPRVVRGDLRHDLANLAAQAPTEATLVIFHTAVLVYVRSDVERSAFADQATELERGAHQHRRRRAEAHARREQRQPVREEEKVQQIGEADQPEQ